MRRVILFAASGRARPLVDGLDRHDRYPRLRWELVIGLFILAFAIWLFLLFSVDTHDSWISRGGLKNGAGEWCCGEGDCFVIPGQQVSARADGYHIVFRQTTSVYAPKTGGTVETTQTRAEIVPYSEAQPSSDGAYWRCKRPDGSRRCFFAPPANS